jgi:predicted ATP-dependent serine protease
MHDWSQYLKPADFEYLVQYIENVKNGVPNSKMIILAGEPGTGKSTLMDDIERYLGDKLCGDLPISCEFIYNETIKKLGFFRGLDSVDVCTDKNTQAIINLIKYKQSFIASVQDELNMSFDLMDHCYVIQMSHVF